MASFNFRRRDPVRRAGPLDGPADGPADGQAPSGEALPAAGPGWYESSWELHRGLLVVHEALPADAPLHEWLLQCGQPPPCPPVGGGMPAPPSDT